MSHFTVCIRGAQSIAPASKSALSTRSVCSTSASPPGPSTPRVSAAATLPCSTSAQGPRPPSPIRALKTTAQAQDSSEFLNSPCLVVPNQGITHLFCLIEGRNKGCLVGVAYLDAREQSCRNVMSELHGGLFPLPCAQLSSGLASTRAQLLNSGPSHVS